MSSESRGPRPDWAHRAAYEMLADLGVFSPARNDKLAAMLRERCTPAPPAAEGNDGVRLRAIIAQVKGVADSLIEWAHVARRRAEYTSEVNMNGAARRLRAIVAPAPTDDAPPPAAEGNDPATIAAVVAWMREERKGLRGNVHATTRCTLQELEKMLESGAWRSGKDGGR